MSYPYSITHTTTIQLPESSSREQLVEYFNRKLQLLDCHVIQEHPDKITLRECKEFSSGTSSLINVNRGYIKFEQMQDTIEIKSSIIVYEHFISFVLCILLTISGIVNYNKTPVMLTVGLIALLAGFVFFYLIPLMSLYSFIKGVVNEVKREAVINNKE